MQPLTLPAEKESERLAFLRRCVSAHVDSFDFAMGPGLALLPEEIEPVTVRTEAGQRVVLRLSAVSITRPRAYDGNSANAVARDLLPTECRRAGVTYVGDLMAAFSATFAGEVLDIPMRKLARIPIMLGSSKCNLKGKSPKELVAMGEEEYELGGVFIINGSEKLMRMVIVPRPNHAVSAKRKANESRGSLFTDLSLAFRSMRRDMSTRTVHLHLLRTGSVTLRVTIDRSEYFVPVGLLLRALLPSETTERDIFEMIVGGEHDNRSLCASALAIVVGLHDRTTQFNASDAEPDTNPTVSRMAALAYLGRSFRVALNIRDPDSSDVEAGLALLRRLILVNLSVGPFEEASETLDRSKADTLVHLIRKLVASSTGEIEIDDADALSHQGILLPGQLYLQYLKERLESFLRMFAAAIRRESERNVSSARQLLANGMMKATRKDIISAQMQYMLATGNLKSESGLDLPQAVGYTIIAERINFLRYFAHFRCVHRGAFYAQMRSTKVRKLLPEAWGFICPVHTPDGDPCGILNHLASQVSVTQGPVADTEGLIELISDFNVTPSPAFSSIHPTSPPKCMPLVADGRVMGFVSFESAPELVEQLRYAKVKDTILALPANAEIVLVERVSAGSGFYPGIYIYTGGCRLVRPVKWLSIAEKSRKKKRTAEAEGTAEVGGRQEWIGTYEQVFLRIRPPVDNQEGSVVAVDNSQATHAELSSTAFLSVLASLSPFPDMNQGPRNMFQCQMAKQAMGTPCHYMSSRMESKVYRLTTPQVPITRNFCTQDPMGADLFPNGLNAIVAVISYTGNDMEDALIINKGSLNRGFAHGAVYVNKRVDLDDSTEGQDSQFVPLTESESEQIGTVDVDGLPAVGTRLVTGAKLYGTCARHLTSSETGGRSGKSAVNWVEHRSVEIATVDEVILTNSEAYKAGSRKVIEGVRQANIRTRVSRPPSVGDKFASRAGQKGTVAAAWPTEDMPFAESGMVPDILFNPNGFPSRMTIGMMVESMSGKSGALHGQFNDSTPFRFDEKNRAVDFFAQQLVNAGYDYYGSETLYSGYTGEPFKVNIFMGVVHYQRLRHMVSDKFQVRSTGKVHPLFRQPIKGRKRGGAIRFGEMERDGLLAHGASFLLRDRLSCASDLHILHVCERCGSVVAPVTASRAGGPLGDTRIECRICTKEVEDLGTTVRKVAIPYSFKYMANELAAMNIRTVMQLKELRTA